MVKKCLLYNLFVFALILNACTTNQIYNHHINIPNYIWNRDHKVQLKVAVPEQVSQANVSLTLRYAYQYQHPNLKFEMLIKSPDEESIAVANIHNVSITNEEGKPLGSGLGDIWDITIPLHTAIPLSKGTYEYELLHLMRPQMLSGVMAVGLIVEKI